MIPWMVPGSATENELPGEVLCSEVVIVSEEEMKVAPRRLAAKAGGDLPTITDPKTGLEHPQSTSFQARAPLGLYGHFTDYAWLRGRLEHSPTSDTWQLRYLPKDVPTDRFGGVARLPDASRLSGYEHDDFVELKGQWTDEKPSRSAPDYEVTEIRRLDQANGLLRLGLRGSAKVHTKWMPLGTRLWRFIRHTFRFKL